MFCTPPPSALWQGRETLAYTIFPRATEKPAVAWRGRFISVFYRLSYKFFLCYPPLLITNPWALVPGRRGGEQHVRMLFALLFRQNRQQKRHSYRAAFHL